MTRRIVNVFYPADEASKTQLDRIEEKLDRIEAMLKPLMKCRCHNLGNNLVALNGCPQHS